MATVSAGDIYRAELAAGFAPPAALTGTEIALAESGGNPAAQGDVALQDGTWGPSYGLWQIRTLKRETGTGSTRDITALASGITAQARAEYVISGGGSNWSPWTTYRTGRYRQFESTAAAAAGVTSSTGGGVPSSTPIGDAHPFPTWGPTWLPWNWLPDAGNVAAGQVSSTLSGVRQLALEAVAGAAAVGLVVGGLYVLARPGIRRRVAAGERAIGAVL
jgi:hypothetical protein